MAKLTKEEKALINRFAKEKGLLKIIKDHLDLHKMDFEVEIIKLKPKTVNDTEIALRRKCDPGFELREFCTISGKCEWKCVRIS